MKSLSSVLLRITLIFFLMLGVGAGLSAQKPADLVGTWIGPATLEGQSEANELTLVLELKEGKLTGHMTGEYGTLNEAGLTEISLAEGVFSFAVMAESPEGEAKVVFKMKVKGDSMTGDLEIPDFGMYGTWEATKQ
jgi:hypothetical protein